MYKTSWKTTARNQAARHLRKDTPYTSTEIADTFASACRALFAKWVSATFQSKRLALHERVRANAFGNAALLFKLLEMKGVCTDVACLIILEYCLPEQLLTCPLHWMRGVDWQHMWMSQVNSPRPLFPYLGKTGGHHYYTVNKYAGFTKVRLAKKERKRKRHDL